MKAFMDVDIEGSLQRVIKETTIYHPADYEYDIGFLKTAVYDKEGRDFLWMAYDSGTHMYPERDVFFKDTAAYYTWTYYKNRPQEVTTFWIHVDTMRDGMPKGNLIALDYPLHCKMIKELAVEPDSVDLTFRNGYAENVTFREYQSIPLSANGGYQAQFNHSQVEERIRLAHQRLNPLIEAGNFEEYLQSLRLEHFSPFGYRNGDFVRIGLGEARQCMDIGIDILLFQKDHPYRKLQNRQELNSIIPYGSHLAVRQEDMPLVEYMRAGRNHFGPLLTDRELSLIMSSLSLEPQDFEHITLRRKLQAMGHINNLQEQPEVQYTSASETAPALMG